MTMPWMYYFGRDATIEQKIEGMTRFADDVIRPLAGASGQGRRIGSSTVNGMSSARDAGILKWCSRATSGSSTVCSPRLILCTVALSLACR